jgi:hypothetical protein
MAKGIKTGGRKKGTPNKDASEIADILSRLNCNPIEGLARIANGEELLCGVSTITGFTEVKHRPTFAQRLKAYTELAEYVAPKRKAVEVAGEGGGPVRFTLALSDAKGD